MTDWQTVVMGSTAVEFDFIRTVAEAGAMTLDVTVSVTGAGLVRGIRGTGDSIC